MKPARNRAAKRAKIDARMLGEGFLSVANAAAQSGLSAKTIYAWAEKKLIRSRRVGLKYVYVSAADMAKISGEERAAR